MRELKVKIFYTGNKDPFEIHNLSLQYCEIPYICVLKMKWHRRWSYRLCKNIKIIVVLGRQGV